jgi:hypothetical protein
MSTMLVDHDTHWVVATVTGFGSRKKLPRNRVRVEKGDAAALAAEVIRQADAARQAAGIPAKQ